MTDPLVPKAAETHVSAAGSAMQIGRVIKMNPDVLKEAVRILQDIGDVPNLDEFSVLADIHADLDPFGVTDESAKDPSQTSMGKAVANHLMKIQTTMQERLTALGAECTTVAQALDASANGWLRVEDENTKKADAYDKLMNP